MAEKSNSPEDAAPGGNERRDPAKRKHGVRTGVAVGIGSAAIVAALLYANRGRKGDKGGNG